MAKDVNLIPRKSPIDLYRDECRETGLEFSFRGFYEWWSKRKKALGSKGDNLPSLVIRSNSLV